MSIYSTDSRKSGTIVLYAAHWMWKCRYICTCQMLT